MKRTQKQIYYRSKRNQKAYNYRRWILTRGIIPTRVYDFAKGRTQRK